MWVDNEEYNLKKEICLSRRKAISRFNNFRLGFLFAILCGIATIMIVSSFTNYASYKYFPDTWKCSNPDCGYENYDGINYCALCGTPRHSK